MGNNLEQLEIHQGNVIKEFRSGGNVRTALLPSSLFLRIQLLVLCPRQDPRTYHCSWNLNETSLEALLLRFPSTSAALRLEFITARNDLGASFRLSARNGVNMSSVSNPGMFYVTTEEWAACCAFDPHAAHAPRSQIVGANNTTSSSIASDESYISE